MSLITTFLIVSALTMGISHTIAKERLFRPLRERLGGEATWCGYLVSCPYCCSHWVAFVLVPLTGAYFVPIAWDLGWFTLVVQWFLSSILVAVGAAFLRVVFYLVDQTQGLARREQTKTEEETEEVRAHRTPPSTPYAPQSPEVIPRH